MEEGEAEVVDGVEGVEGSYLRSLRSRETLGKMQENKECFLQKLDGGQRSFAEPPLFFVYTRVQAK